jgi:6,7-dimethyl-8-ribityllumazine synthase
MARNERADGALAPPPPELDGKGRRVAIVAARFNDRIVTRLLAGALDGLATLGVADDDVDVSWVPGAFELPLAAKTCAATGRFDAVIALGCVIRGDTAHFEYVAGPCAEGIQQAQLDTGVPIVFGVLTTENLDQALDRSDHDGERAGGEDKGDEAAATAIEMALLLDRIRKA